MSIHSADSLSPNGPKVFSLSSDISTAIVLGSGYDSRTKTVMNIVAEGGSKKESRLNAAPQYFIDWCENYTELSSFFGLSASASYSGAGSGFSASASIVRATAIESSRIYIAVWVHMIANMEFYPDARLTKDALEVLKAGKLPRFSEKYGGKYAKAIYCGGELACVLEISASQTETIEQLRIAMAAQGWGAKGQGELEQALRELTRTRSVVVRYCQSGGAIGSVTSGVIVTDAEGVILRMKQFIGEVWGTNGLDGSVVPLQAELLSVRQLTNWPDEQTGDPDRPYPEEIEQIAKSVSLLKDKLVIVEDVLRPNQPVSPGAVDAAKAVFPYLQFVIGESARELGKMMRGASSGLDYSIESFYQYRYRNFLAVDPGDHRNAGPQCNLGLADSQQFLDRVFGKAIPAPYERWPQLALQEWWGYQGQEPGAFAGVHVICPQHGGSLMDTARALAGNPGPNDGVLVHVSIHPSPYGGGGACGYHPIYMLAIRNVRPNVSPLNPLPLLPDDTIDKSAISIKNGELTQVDTDTWNASFSIALADSASCGRYSMAVTETLSGKKDVVRRTTLASYWITKAGPTLVLNQLIKPEEGWAPSGFEVVVDVAYRLRAENLLFAERVLGV